jgi:hypothetical protein
MEPIFSPPRHHRVGVNRRQFLTACGLVATAGCTGGRGDRVTMLAVNEHDASHTVTVWVVRGERLRVAETVDVAAGEFERVADLPPDDGSGDPYRVTVQVDGEVALAREFRPETWFNQLDVFITGGGTVELNRGQAA